MILGAELAGRDHQHPLETDDNLDQDTEDEEEDLVHFGEVDIGTESDADHLLDHERGIYDNVGEPCAKPNGYADNLTLLHCKGEPKSRA